MRLILQRVANAEVRVEGQVVGAIGPGILALVGIEKSDTPATAEMAARKISQLRIFSDEEGKMNRSLLEARGSCLVVSQFTLAASLDRGRRPSFGRAARAAEAQPLVLRLIEKLEAFGIRNVESGVFGAIMKVHLVNDGPVTFVLDLPSN